VLGEAAARLTELSIIHHTWHPSLTEALREIALPANENYTSFIHPEGRQ
jgi:hypothetical protein